MIILRAIKGEQSDATWCKVIVHANWSETEFALVHHILSRSYYIFVPKGFVTKELLDFHC